VRIVGIFLLACGIYLATLINHVFEGTSIPVPWLGYCGIGLAFLMIAVPSAGSAC
jgi:hypothetical protein